MYNNVKEQIKRHIFILLFILFLFVIHLIANIFVPERMAFLAGEYTFSFDYFGHIRNIISDLRSQNILLSSTKCEMCPDFFHYSRWFALIQFNIIGTSNILNLNPFIYYIFLNIVFQILALYIFSVLVLKNFNKIAFTISSTVFILLPYKFAILGSGTTYSFHYAFLLIIFTLIIYILRNIQVMSLKRVFAISTLIGLVGSLFLNVSIGYFPILLYSLLILIVFYSTNVVINIRKLLLVPLIALPIISIINFPIILSIVRGGQSRVFEDYVSYDLLSSYTFGVGGSFPISSFLVSLFCIVIIFLLIKSDITRKSKILLIILYLISGVFLHGKNSIINFYEYVFSYFPLMDSIRSNHRFLFYQTLVLFIIIYTGISYLIRSKNKILLALVPVVSIILICIPLSVIYTNKEYIHTVTVPQDYFETDKYLGKLEGKKIYMPFYMPVHQSMSRNYNWYSDSVIHPVIYTNPFTSLFAAPDMVSVEGYTFSSVEETEVRTLLDYRRPIHEFISTLGTMNVKYLILDRNFEWGKLLPEVDLQDLENELKLERKFGNLYVYRIPAANNICKKSYGDYLPGYCNVKSDIPEYLVNTTVKEYLIDKYAINNSDKRLGIKNKKGTYNLIVDSTFQDYLYLNAIHIPFEVNFTENEVVGLYKEKAPKGEYILLVPVFVTTDDNKFFKDSKLKVHIGSKDIHEIIPYGKSNNMLWKEFYIRNEHEEDLTITIDKLGEGYMVYGNPMLLERGEYKRILSDLEEFNPAIIR